MITWLSDFWTYLGTISNPIKAIVGIFSIIAAAFYLPRWLIKRRSGPERVLLANPEVLLMPPMPIQMTVEGFSDIQRKLRDEARADLAQAHGEERKRLEDKIDALNQRLANPDEALAQQHAIILDLEAQLTRRGNDIGGDRLAEAKSALEQGDFTAARALFEDLQARTAPDVQANAAAAFALGQIAEAEIRWHDAAEHYERAARLNPTFDTFHKAREFAWRSGDYPAALHWGEDMLTVVRSGTDQLQLSLALNENALTLAALGRYSEAEELYRKAQEIDRATIGEAHPDYAIHLNNLASVVRAQGRFLEAEGLFRQSLEIDRATIGEAHPDYATHLNNLAGVVQAQGRFPEAEGLFRQSLAIALATIGEAHPAFATHLSNLALVVQAQGRCPEAEGLFRQALEIDSATIGEAHPDYATHLNNLAGVVQAQGRYPEAEGLFRQALEIGRATIGEAHPAYASRLNNLAGVVQAQQRYAEADGLYKQCLAILRSKLGDQHPTTQTIAQNYLSLLEAHNPTSPDIPAMRALLGG